MNYIVLTTRHLKNFGVEDRINLAHKFDSRQVNLTRQCSEIEPLEALIIQLEKKGGFS